MDRHRCLAIAPYRSALTRSRVLAASLLTWIIAGFVFLPVVFWFKSKDIAGNLTICTLVFPRSDVVNVSLCFTVPIIVLACLLPMTLLVYHYQRIFQKILDTRSRWAVPCVAQVIRPAVNLLHRIITAALCLSVFRNEVALCHGRLFLIEGDKYITGVGERRNR